jgi:hypothetical protein
MTRTIAPTTLVIGFAAVFVLGILPRPRLMSKENAPTKACAAASDSPASELFSLSRPRWPALSLKSAGRPSMGRYN